MTEVEARRESSEPADRPVVVPAKPVNRPMRARRFRIVPLLITLVTATVAAAFGWAMWKTYMQTPWTRAGRIVELPVIDNQFVHKGDLLLVIDPTDYKIALKLADAAVERMQATAQNVQIEAERRRKLTDLAVTQEEQQTCNANAVAARAQYHQAVANRDQAQVNLDRTQIRSPVNGWVTNLLARVGDYATVGRSVISVVDADSFWVDAYFEETSLPPFAKATLPRSN
jgi:RND family efflux transporter MFP subunit